MALASAIGTLLKPQTPLQQLLEDINFQRTKEMRQLLKDDSGFVVLQGTTYWTDLFVRHFLFQTEPVHSIDSDDLLFFVRKKHVKSSSRHMPKYETEVEVFRKDSRKLPIGDPDVDWEETVYLNMVIHQFDYTLTLAICTRTSPKELQVLRRHSQRVYASPSRRKMDTKGEGEEITYPHICFMVDNFDEVFSDILVRDGEMVCVELVANDKDGAVQGVIFLGSIRYDALKKVYDARQSSLSSKVAQRMSFGLFSSGATVQTRCEFVRMKGPQGKGHAEMAVTKPKGSGVETPTSEPGFCATDMWEDWEEENDDYCTYRHQRRLSDPSANLNNFTRYGWRTKHPPDTSGGGAGAKARSENEGLDSLASEVSEIEAGDLRDDLRPAFSAKDANTHPSHTCEANEQVGESPATAVPVVADAVDVAEVVVTSPTASNQTTGCSNCFSSKKCKRWVVRGRDKSTPEMSEIYCLTCDDPTNATPACLNTMPDKTRAPTPKLKTILSVDSELVVGKRERFRLSERKRLTRSSSLSAADKRVIKKIESLPNRKEKLEQHCQMKSREKNKDKEKFREKDKLKIEKIEREKAKEKEKVKEKVSKSTNLLAKVSPKRIRTKLTEKSKSNNNNQHKKKNTNHNGNVEVETEIALTTHTLLAGNELSKSQEFEIADDATSLNGDLAKMTDAGREESTRATKMFAFAANQNELIITVRGHEELPVKEEDVRRATEAQLPPTAIAVKPKQQQPKTLAVDQHTFEKCVRVPVNLESHPLQLSTAVDCTESKQPTTIADNNSVNGLLYQHDTNTDTDANADAGADAEATPSETTPMLNDVNGNETATPPVSERNDNDNDNDDNVAKQIDALNDDGIPHAVDAENEVDSTVHLTTLPRAKRIALQQACYNKALKLVPKRRTPDGTNIYYWCDLSKNTAKELDDGAYNPLWASRGFTQSFHFWKENRRQQSTPLNAFLTYVTLPWWSIAKDLLDHRETPILTF